MVNRKLNGFFAYVLLAIVLSSCDVETKFPNSQSKFLVKRIQTNKTKGTNLYLVEPIDKMDLNMNGTGKEFTIQIFISLLLNDMLR